MKFTLCALVAVLFVVSLSGAVHAQTAAENYAASADEKLDEKNYDGAIADATRAIELKYAKLADAYWLRALAKLGKRDLDAFLADSVLALAASTDAKQRSIFYEVRGVVALARKDPSTAMAEYNKAVDADPTNFNALQKRAGLRVKNKDLAGAVADLNKAIQQPGATAAIYGDRARIYMQTGRTELAMADVQKAFSIDPNYEDGYGIRGWAYLTQLEYAKASDDIWKAVQYDQENVQLRLMLAWALLYARNPIIAYQQASMILQSGDLGDAAASAVIISYLADRKTGHNDDARAFVAKWVNKFPADSWNGKMLRYLNGQLTAEQLLAAANDVNKKTDATALIGIDLSLSGETSRAATHTDWVKLNGNKSSYFYYLAANGLTYHVDTRVW